MQIPPPVAPEYCHNCGLEMHCRANFCQRCGARLKLASGPAWLHLTSGCLLMLIALATASSGAIFLLIAGFDAMNSLGSSVVFGLTGLMLIGLAAGCIYWLIQLQHK